MSCMNSKVLMLFINWPLGTNESSGVGVTQVEQQTAGILWNGHPYDVNIMIMNFKSTSCWLPSICLARMQQSIPSCVLN